jgi:peroxiredoxin
MKTARLRRPTTSLRSVCGLALAGLVLSAGSVHAEPIREGTGERRAALDAMELKPFDQSLWSKLESWTNGDAVDGSSTDGKVVVIYTFSSFLNTSMRPMVALDRLQKRYADQGVVVVGVHHPQGWERAAEQVARRRVGFPIAHDADGTFREALRVDQDPDLFVIDRAGQLRYADIETGSIDAAVAELVKERPADAASLLDRRAAASREADAEARRSASLRAQIDLADLPEIPFVAPTPEEYEAVEWPTMYEYEDPTRGGGGGRQREREEDSARPIELPEDGNYAPAPPRSRDGRMTLLYFWTPEEGMAAWNTFYDQIQAIQREHVRDLVVVGVAVPFEQDNRRGRGRNNEQEERDKKLRESKERFESFFSKKPLNHVLLDQIDDSPLLNTVTSGSGRRGRSDTIWLPYAALVSSDGMLRWHGHLGAHFEEYRDALARMLRDDPGVKARRAAEEAFINEQVARRLENGGG